MSDEFGKPGTPMVLERPDGSVFLKLDALEADVLREAARADGVSPLQWLANVADTEMALAKAVEPLQNAAIERMCKSGRTR